MPEDDLASDRASHRAEVCDQIHEQVVDGQHAHDAVVPDKRQAATSMTAEDRQCRSKIGVGMQRDHIYGHDRVDAGIGRHVTRDAAHDDVTIGHDTRKPLAVHHDQRADVGDFHDLGCV